MVSNPLFGRNARRLVTAYNANFHLETFLVSSVATVILIRLFLGITGFPKLGGDGLHIAHMLYGGILMLVAILMQLTLLGDRPRATSAVLGGIGFGFFIDEIGKYLTQDNNYFFRPAVVIMYVFFLALYFSFRIVEARRSRGQQAHIANALELLQEGLLHGFNYEEKRQLDANLDAIANFGGPIAAPLKELSKSIEVSARRDQPTLGLKVRAIFAERYDQLISWSGFSSLLYIVFGIQAVLSLYTLADFIRDTLSGESIFDSSELHRSQVGQFIGVVLYGAVVLYGLNKLRRGERLRAYGVFKVALLLNIFVTQFFAFYREQFSAFPGLLLNLLLLGGVNYLMRFEHSANARANLRSRPKVG